MGRRPKPATLHMRQGTYQPCRHGVSPQGGGDFWRPDGLGKWGNWLYDRIEPLLTQCGAGECDMPAIMMMCIEFEEYMRSAGYRRKRSPKHEEHGKLHRVATRSLRNALDLISRFGGTPSDRMKLKTDAEEAQDAFDELLGRRGA